LLEDNWRPAHTLTVKVDGHLDAIGNFTEIGKERGWPPITRRQFEALPEPDGALFVGNPRSVADKFLFAKETLGEIETASLQMSVASLPHAKRMYATELLGTKVAPAVRDRPVCNSGVDSNEVQAGAVSCRGIKQKRMSEI
jgi:hypothetical protein